MEFHRDSFCSFFNKKNRRNRDFPLYVAAVRRRGLRDITSGAIMITAGSGRDRH